MSVINLFAPYWNPADSYGRLACELAAHLEASGVVVNRFGEDATNQTVQIRLGGLLLGYPTLYERFGALAQMNPRIAITMFESTRLPDGWAENLNQCDAVVVPSQFLVDVMRDCGVTVPIYVVPLGISEAFTRTVIRRSDEKPFTFVAIGDRGRRKGWHKTLFAFVRAFGDDMRYRLIIKARTLGMRLKNRNIEVLEVDYSDAALADLYRRCHCMVFPTAAEGFGLPPREFAATGGVVLATNWGGTADDLSEWGIPINDYALVDAWKDRSDWYGRLGQWADVDIDALAAQMRYVADHFDELANAAIRGAAFVQQQYRWDAFAERVWQLWVSIKEQQYASAGQ